MPGWGSFLDRVWERFIPSREESIRNKIAKLESEINKIEDTKWDSTTANKLADLIHRLSEEKSKLENR